MSRTVTALFDTRQEAEAAKARLQSSNIDADRVRIIDQSESHSGSSTSATSSDGENRGFFSSLTNMFLPDEDAYSYQEGINRGGFLLTASVDEDEADQAIRLLEESNSVDFESRQQEWRSQGWGGYDRDTHGSQYTSAGAISASGTPNTAGHGQQTTGYNQQSQSVGETGRAVAEEHIPIVEEELRVGKRETQRGGAHVRSYVRETPVHEQVSLRDEHVSVERRPVDRRVDAADLNSGDLLRERDIEMTETHEEAVVAKEARVREELVVRKTAEDHVEQIDDTVRRTEVEVDEGNTGRTTGRTGESAFGFGNDRDRDGTPDALDTRDRSFASSGQTSSGQGGLTGDRDGDGMPNAFDTTDRNRR